MQVKKGDKVKVHYTLKTEDGEVMESSVGAVPMEFTVGEGKVIQGFDNGVIGMKSGDSKTITVSENEAYGFRDEKKIFEYGKDRIPQGFEPQIGQIVQMHTPDGKGFPVTILGFTDKGFKMDANHPLAGKTLIFDLELVEIIT